MKSHPKKNEKVKVKASRSFYRKCSEVDDHHRKGVSGVKIEEHTRNPRRTKEQIKKYGTRKDPKYRW